MYRALVAPVGIAPACWSQFDAGWAIFCQIFQRTDKDLLESSPKCPQVCALPEGLTLEAAFSAFLRHRQQELDFRRLLVHPALCCYSLSREALPAFRVQTLQWYQQAATSGPWVHRQCPELFPEATTIPARSSLETRRREGLGLSLLGTRPQDNATVIQSFCFSSHFPKQPGPTVGAKSCSPRAARQLHTFPAADICCPTAAPCLPFPILFKTQQK